MNSKALVSGCDERVGQVAEALRAEGADVVAVEDPSRLREVALALDPASLSCYVQLPVRVEATGQTLVGRVRTFLQEGLLARFDAVDAVLPALKDDATVVLVSGNTAVTSDRMPDDAAARFALLNVLAHAVRAEKAPGMVRVRMLERDTETSDIAAVALRGERRRPLGMAQIHAREAELSYEDWRAEIMGLATVEV